MRGGGIWGSHIVSREGISGAQYDVVPPGEREGSDTNVQQSPECTGKSYLMFPPVEGEFD